MDDVAITEYTTGAFAGVTTQVVDGNIFFFCDPTHMFPFATLMTNDINDQFSNLNRPGVFRLNIGVDKDTFLGLFGGKSGEYDFTAFDTIMPHPVYGAQRWVCVLNPSEATFEETIKPMLANAYKRDVRKHTK